MTTVYHYDAFSTTPGKGNPAGVVLDGEGHTEAQMQEIARQVGFNETAFPMASDVADIRIRFFTPGHEINLCGHATMATLYAMKTHGLLGARDELTMETRAGILPIKIVTEEGKVTITMKQAAPQFVPFLGNAEALARSIGLEHDDLESQLPIVYGSTGTWTLLIPIKKLQAFKCMRPDNTCFPNVLEEMPHTSLHPFCLETIDSTAHMHARHFSSPYSGTVEDPITGTASGVMGAYYATYIMPGSSRYQLVVEQGQEIGRDGRVEVIVDRNDGGLEVAIRGTAVYVGERKLTV